MKAGRFGAWTPMGAEPTVGSYKVAWQHPGTPPQYSIWTTDSNCHAVDSTRYAAVTAVLTSLHPIYKEHLDALGSHGTPPLTTTVIEAFGSTSLVEVGT